MTDPLLVIPPKFAIVNVGLGIYPLPENSAPSKVIGTL